MKKVVLDTNIIVSGLLNPHGAPGKVLAWAFERKFHLVSSDHLLDELQRSLRYPKVVEALGRARKGWTEQDATELVKNFRHICELAPSTPLAEEACKDPGDDWVLSGAMEAGAEVIVTGDKALRGMGQYEGISILTATEFLQQLS